MKLVHVSNEPNSDNTSGCCTALYFDQKADEAAVKVALRYVLKNRSEFPDAPLVAEPDDEFFSFKERSTSVSEKAGLFRYECCGSC